ncbi:helix-turn-helix domain-containing protein [Nocardioides gansuensis]|uniref:helix-turn-helix domain-containing protein n=1 Tax=Nocardioides gansuensis TaxID=2138300 RepID=UPI00318302A3
MWAEWYREVQAQLEQRREERRLELERRRVAREQRGLERRRRGPASSSLDAGREPPGPHGWLTTKQAAEILGVTPATVHRHAGSLETHHGAQLWVTEESVLRLREERRRWMSWQEAADLIGCSRHAVAKLLAAGHLNRRQVNRAVSLSPASVEAAARVHAEQQKAADQARAADRLAKEHALRERTAPPDDGEVWLDVTTAALLLGVTANSVRQRIRHGRVPATRRGRRFWLRRVDVEQASAAAAFHAKVDASGVGNRI